MKNIFRKSVQIFHKKDKGESPSSSPSSKKDKKLKQSGTELNTSSDSSFIKANLGLPIVQENGADEAQLLNTLQSFVYNPNARKVFGVPLQQVPRRNGSNIPIIVEKLLDHLEKTALTTEGVFRIPGRDILITHYVKLFDNGDDVDVSPIEPYTAAGLLKRFFRDLPIFVPQQINKRVASLFITEDGKKKQADLDVLSKLRFLVHQLPSVHFEVMQALTNLLSKLMSKSDQNKMTISNIAICLVPTLNCVPAIVTYPIQYFEFFFNEIFNEHHLYHMRPYQTNIISSVMEEKQTEHLSSQPMLIPNSNQQGNNVDQNRRYSRSRPASITISGLLPNGAPTNSSPSSSTITSTITSPHDSVMFTVTTTFIDDPNNNNNNASQTPLNQTQNIDYQQQQQSQPQQQTYNKSERRGYKLDTLDLTQFMNMDDPQYQSKNYQQQQQPITNNNNNNNNNILSSSPNSLSSLLNNSNNMPPMSQQLQQDMKSLYRRSIAIGNTSNTLPSLVSNEDTKAAIQQIKEKIDRYASNTVNNIKKDRNKDEKEKEKMLRYSIDYERFKDRYQKEKRQSRDVNKEIEREIEKRLSPRERVNLLLSLQQQSTTATNNMSASLNFANSGSISSSTSGSNSNIGSGSGIGSFMKDKSYRYSVSNNNSQIPLYQQLSGRFSNRFTKSDINDELYYYEQLMHLQQQQVQQSPPMQQPPITPLQPISAIPQHVGSLNRQRSQSCFEPENLISIQQNILQQQQQQQQQQSTTSYIEQKLDKIRELINITSSGDNRISRDYTHFLKEIDELKSELQKESVTSEFYANKSLELQDRLRIEEEKNQRLVDEVQLMESYFLLKEKAKLSKRLSTTKEIMTRSRSPTLPTSINPLTGLTTSTSNIPNLNSSSNSINSYSSSPTSSSGSSKDILMNQMLRGPNRNLVNLIPSSNNNGNSQPPYLFVSQPPN